MSDAREKRLDAAVDEAMTITLVMLLLAVVAAVAGPLSWPYFFLFGTAWWLVLWGRLVFSKGARP